MSKKLEHYIFVTSNLVNMIVEIFINLFNLIYTYQESKNILIKLNKESKTTEKEYQNISRIYRLLMNTILFQPFISKIFKQQNFLKLETEDYSLLNKNSASEIKKINLSRYFTNQSLYYLNQCSYYVRDQKIFFPQKSILAYYPHNFCAYGYILNGILSPYLDDDIHWATSRFLSNEKNYPWTNSLNKDLHICNVENLKEYLILNRKIGIVPGGFYDATLTNYNQINCYVSIGSIKYSIDYGYNYIPVFTFGEEYFYSKYYKSKDFLNTREEKLLHKLNIPTIFPKDNLIIPGSNKTLITIIGLPINCKNKKINDVQILVAKQITYLYQISCNYFYNQSELKIHLQEIKPNHKRKN